MWFNSYSKYECILSGSIGAISRIIIGYLEQTGELISILQILFFIAATLSIFSHQIPFLTHPVRFRESMHCIHNLIKCVFFFPSLIPLFLELSRQHALTRINISDGLLCFHTPDVLSSCVVQILYNGLF